VRPVGISLPIELTALMLGATAISPVLLGWWFGFWLTARALVTVRIHDLPVYAGAHGVAWLVGFVAVYAPGGLGVREAVLVR
jgi:glycosyltransferase 2 family protein